MENKISSKDSILKLFRDLIQKKLIFTMRIGLDEYPVKILRLKNDSIIFDASGYFKGILGFINFYFLIDNDIYFGQTKINEITSLKEMIADFPTILYYRPERKHVRVSTQGKVRCNFNIISFNGNNDENDNKDKGVPYYLRHIYYELNKNTPDIKKIFTAILDEVKKISSQCEIKLYKPDTKLNQFEKIIQTYKKALFVKDSTDMKNYMMGYENPLFISFGKLFQSKINQEAWDQNKIKETCIKLMTMDKALKRLSYAYIPIMHFNEISGHVYAAYDYSEKKKYEDKDIILFKAFTDIIAEALTKHKLFSAGGYDDAKIVIENISSAGMMFHVKDQYLLKFLKKDTRLSINGYIQDKEFSAIGKILRVQKFPECINMGIRITEISAKDEKIIKEFVETIKQTELY